MDVSSFLAKLIGIYFILIAILWLFRSRQISDAIKEIVKSKGLLAISGEFSLIFGLVILLDHPVWEWNWRGLLTLLGCFFIVRGVLRLAFPLQVQRIFSHIQKETWWPLFLVLLVIGAYLAYSGFAYSG